MGLAGKRAGRRCSATPPAQHTTSAMSSHNMMLLPACRRRWWQEAGVALQGGMVNSQQLHTGRELLRLALDPPGTT